MVPLIWGNPHIMNRIIKGTPHENNKAAYTLKINPDKSPAWRRRRWSAPCGKKELGFRMYVGSSKGLHVRATINTSQIISEIVFGTVLDYKIHCRCEGSLKKPHMIWGPFWRRVRSPYTPYSIYLRGTISNFA